jgi:hypothetical protein
MVTKRRVSILGFHTKFGQSKEGKIKNLLDERMAKRRGEDIGFPASYSRRPGF